MIKKANIFHIVHFYMVTNYSYNVNWQIMVKWINNKTYKIQIRKWRIDMSYNINIREDILRYPRYAVIFSFAE